jgi:hypothetical protein
MRRNVSTTKAASTAAVLTASLALTLRKGYNGKD